MALKILNRGKAPKKTSASTPQDWALLCQKALQRAKSLQDRRAAGLQKALESHTEMRVLKALNIICEADIEREFSKPQT
jgi:hypothetical protein